MEIETIEGDSPVNVYLIAGSTVSLE